MNGEKLQWMIQDGEQYTLTKPMTADEIAALMGSLWYRPFVTYNHEHDSGGLVVEIHDTGHWLESKRKMDEMRRRNGIELGEGE